MVSILRRSPGAMRTNVNASRHRRVSSRRRRLGRNVRHAAVDDEQRRQLRHLPAAGGDAAPPVLRSRLQFAARRGHANALHHPERLVAAADRERDALDRLGLPGYDVQPVNLYDVFALGALPPTSSKTAVPINPTLGSQPADNDANPNFFPGATAACAGLPSSLAPQVVSDLRLVFTTGVGAGCASQVGGVHANAIGYATIDVVANCAAKNASASDYFTTLLLFDNVLTGDYQILVP